MLSKTSVSVATLAANEVFRLPLPHKTVLLMGSSGQMGDRQNLPQAVLSFFFYDKTSLSVRRFCRFMADADAFHLFTTFSRSWDRCGMLTFMPKRPAVPAMS